MSGLKQQARIMDAVQAEMPLFPRVSMPVRITAETHPEIARATEHAKRLAANGGVS